MADETRKLNVFISYSRDDLAFADQLRAALLAYDFAVTIDRESIRSGENWKERLAGLIRDADTIVFVLSLSSARSPVCAWETAEAVGLGKRIIPILCRSLEGVAPPPELSALQYTYFYDEPKFPGSGFGTGLNDLRLALNTDPDWVREHTRYLRLAKEWEEVRKPVDRRLLSAHDIALAKAWVADRPPKAPEIIPLQVEFIDASEAEDIRRQSAEAQRLKELHEALIEKEKALEERKQAQEREAEAQKRETNQAKRVVRRTRLGLAAAISLVLATGTFAYFATKERDRALLQESRALAILAQQASKEGDQPTAMLLALEALPEPGFGGKRPLSYEAAAALNQAWLRNREMALAGHQGPIRSAAFSRDGTHVVTASDDGTARVWDMSGEKPAFVPLEGHEVNSASFSSDGTHVVTASDDGTARVWDMSGEKPAFVPLEGHDGPVRSASFSQDGTHVVTASDDGTARVWDWRAAPPSFVPLVAHDRPLESAHFSDDGTRVATIGSLDRIVRVWDWRARPPSFIPLEHSGWVDSASFSSDGSHILTVAGFEAKVWDTRGKASSVPLIADAIKSASFSIGGELVVIADGDMARVWDWSAKESDPVRLEGHQGSVNFASFSADGRYVVTASDDKTARRWDLRQGERSFVALVGHEGSVTSASIRTDDEYMLTASTDGTARIWDLRERRFIKVGGELSGDPIAASFSADGTSVVTRWRNTAYVWDLRAEPPRLVHTLEGHLAPIDSASFSFDGTHVVTASEDKTARVWDLRMDPPKFVPLGGHKSEVHSAAFSRDGKHVVTASYDGIAQVWDFRVPSPTPVPLDTHDLPIISASLSTDGSRVALGLKNGATQVWDLRGDKPSYVTLDGHKDWVTAVAFSIDGMRVVTASKDGTARVWDLREKSPTFVALEGHQDRVNSAAFSADGMHVVTASDDETARVWDLRGEQPTFVVLEVHEFGLKGNKSPGVSSAVFSPDGNRVFTASLDGRIGAWRVLPNVNELIRFVRAGLTRCLSQTQRDAYGLFTKHPAEDRNFIPPPTADGRCPS